jgi:hypothetical protein
MRFAKLLVLRVLRLCLLALLGSCASARIKETSAHARGKVLVGRDKCVAKGQGKIRPHWEHDVLQYQASTSLLVSQLGFSWLTLELTDSQQVLVAGNSVVNPPPLKQSLHFS